MDELRIKIASTNSDPSTLSDADLSRIQQESQRLHDAFSARTASMEDITMDDMKVRCQ